MGETDPKSGTKIAIRVPNFKETNMEEIGEKMKGIDEKYVEYAVSFHTDTGKKKHSAIVFDRLSEFSFAVKKHRCLMWETTPNYVLPIWVGGHVLFITVEINEETLPVLRRILQKAEIPKNYAGVMLPKEIKQNDAKI